MARDGRAARSRERSEAASLRKLNEVARVLRRTPALPWLRERLEELLPECTEAFRKSRSARTSAPLRKRKSCCASTAQHLSGAYASVRSASAWRKHRPDIGSPTNQTSREANDG